MAGERVGGLLPDCTKLGVVKRAGVQPGGHQHLEEDVDGVGRGKDDQRRTVQGLDRVAHSVVGGQAANFQRGDLHYRGAQVDELAPERIDLMARSGDQDAAAVERAL